jgi:4-hydroxyphenylacetate 3-monooxygenase
MIRTGAEYRDAIRGTREIYIDGEPVRDVTTHPAFRPIVDIRARIFDMAHEAAHRPIMTVTDESGELNPVGSALPMTEADWWAKRRATDHVMEEVGGIVTRVGDETVGEMWSLWDGKDVLNEVDPQFARNIETHVRRVLKRDPFHVSANTDPKGDRSKPPQEQDPDMLLHVVGETDAGIVVRGAKYETAAPYADQAFVKPTIANWGNDRLSDYAVGFICELNASGLKFICRSGFAQRAQEDYPLATRHDEIDALVIFDNVLVPWENVLFYRHTRAAAWIRATLHRYSAFAFVQRTLKLADMMIGTALFNARQTGLDKQQAVQEKLATLAIWRESINAHLTAAITLAERSPAGLLMPNQSLLYAGRCVALFQLNDMMHIARELCGGQICVTPNAASFTSPHTRPWLEKYYSVNEDWQAEDRRKLLALARDMLNSDYGGHRLTFQLFAQSPPFAQLAAVYRSFDWDGPLDFVKKAGGLSDRVMPATGRPPGDGAVTRWYADRGGMKAVAE